MKKLLNRVWYFIFIHLSILAGIDDFSCSEEWDNEKSIWENTKIFVERARLLCITKKNFSIF